MATTAGAITVNSTNPGAISLTSAVATAGTPPYTYQWYRGTSSGFTPGGGNILTGKTALSIVDTTVAPNTSYFYKVVATDSGAVAGTSAAAAAPSAPAALQMNQIGQSIIAGVVDPRMAPNTVSVQIDATQPANTPLYPGAAVKMVDSAGGIPKVIGCTANSDDCCGFLNFDTLHGQFVAGDRAEMSGVGNGIYLIATGAIGRGKSVQLDITTQGGVAQVVGASGASVVGWAFDKAPAAGAVFRVMLGQAVGVLKA